MASSSQVRELTLGITFLSKQLATNAGGPNLTMGTLNALLATLDPREPANAPIEVAQLHQPSAAGDSPFTSAMVEREKAEPLGAPKVK